MKKGITGKSTSQLQKSVKTQFSSATFKKQLDKIINDLYIYTVEFSDRLINKSLSAGFVRAPIMNVLSADDTNTPEDSESLTEEVIYLALTLEAVIECIELSKEIIESIENVLKEEVVNQESKFNLTTKILELWKKNKYRAETWAKTFSADIVNNVALARYEQHGIEECIFSAIIDERTSRQCRALNGLIMKVGSPEARRFLPPLHPRCRSKILPIQNNSKVTDNLRYENRDFTKQTTGEPFNQVEVKKIFENIDKFNEKYKISQSIFNKDIKKRLIKLGVKIMG